jgi:taurine transport system substrate-binding protein
MMESWADIMTGMNRNKRQHRHSVRKFSLNQFWLNRTSHHRQFSILLGIFLLGITLTFAACSSTPTGTLTSPSGAPAAAQIRIGYQVIPNAELLLKAMGTVEKAFPNLKVAWKVFDSGREVNAAMAANALDLGLLGSTETSIGLSNQLPYRIYFLHDMIGDNEALVVKGDIKALRDLNGRKIAVPFGSTAHFSLLSALEELGLKSSEVNILDMQPTAMLAAWQRGDIDAGFVWQPTLSKMVSAKGSILVTAKDLYQKGVITANVGVAHKDFIRNHPARVKKYVALLDEAVKFYREKPEAAAIAIAPELGLSPKESLKVMKELVWLNSSEQAKYLGTADQPGAFAQVLKDSATFMKKRGALPTVPDIKVFQEGLYRQD